MHLKLSAGYLEALKRFVRGNPKRANNVKKAVILFKQNPRHPSLHLEKLQGSRIWTIRLDKGNRIFLTWDEPTAIFVNIGKHDKYRKY